MHCLLTTEPWLGWMELLRAQRARSIALLQCSRLSTALADHIQYLLEYVNTDPLWLAERRKDRADAITARKSIRRSYKMYNRVGRVDTLRKFLQSSSKPYRPLVLEGKRYDYHLIQNPDLIANTQNCNDKTSTAATIVVNKAGERLCQICVYYHDTPPLDFVMATAVQVQNEETEMDILRGGWVMDAARHFYADPILPELKGLKEPNQAPTLVENIINHTVYETANGTFSRKSHIKVKAMPLAFRAFVKIMRCGPQYLKIMRACERFSVWEYVNGDKEATAQLKAVQRALELGVY
jgi:hypothetical protein